MVKLNRKKHFATVYGLAGHHYEQDGKLFNQDGLEVGTGEPEVQQAGTKIEAPVEKVYTETQVKEAVAEAVKEEINAKSEPEEVDELEEEPAEEGSPVEASDMSKKEILDALDSIKKNHLPGIRYSRIQNKETLKKILDNSLERVAKSE